MNPLHLLWLLPLCGAGGLALGLWLGIMLALAQCLEDNCISEDEL